MNEPDSEEDDEGDAIAEAAGRRDGLEPNELPDTAIGIDEVDSTSLPFRSSPTHLDISDFDFINKHSAMTEQVQRMEIVSDPLGSSPATPMDDRVPSSSRPRSITKSSITSDDEIIIFGGRSNGTKNGLPKSKPLCQEPTAQSVQTQISLKVEEEASNVLLDQEPTFSTLHSVFAQTTVMASSPDNSAPTTPASAARKPNFGRRKGRQGPKLTSEQEIEEDSEARYVPTPSKAVPSSLENPTQSSSASANHSPKFGRRKGRRGPRQLSEREIEEEALIQDYIENMKDDESDNEDNVDIKNEHYRFLDGNGEENVKVQTLSRGKQKAPDNTDDELEWSSGDLEDFDDLSTTDDEIFEVSQVVSYRERPSGQQYLVTAAGTDLGEARWVLGTKLTSSTAKTQIQLFKDKSMDKLLLEIADSEDASTDSELDEALMDVRDTIESEGEENERILDRTARMSDAQIAKALAMQEELGMDTTEVMLFDGQEADTNGLTDGDDFVPFSSKQHISNRTRSKQSKRKKDTFPSAEAFADALDQDPYGAFDVMDFDRPSLRPKRKGRKSVGLPFELDDEELALHLQQTYDNDRSKKAARKREREEMRQAGLLGSKAGNSRVDLFTKYQNSGMDAEQIKTEIRSFLAQEAETVAMAPMEAAMRASVHRLAKALGLKSHSQGKDSARFTIITKTPNTPFYSWETIWQVDALMNQRKFFPKNQGSYKAVKREPRSGNTRARKSGGGGVMAGTSYMEGEVVGISAPEIGVGNRGRAMLEKMGWSSGMGIGKEGNQGSTEFVKHVVKNSKAGLG